MTTTYKLEVTTRRDIPEDVIVEHIAYALRGVTDPNKRLADSGVTVRVLTVDRPRNHPFEGPELFDDEPEGEYDLTETVVVFFDPTLDVNDIPTAISEDFPFLSQLFAQKAEEAAATRELHRALDKFENGEGDWQLTDEDNVGEDL